jgi:sirohydrochlorin ferrochelatase
MRAAHLVRPVSNGGPSLILTAHGSSDPRAAAVAHAVAGWIRRLRPELDVRTAFLEQAEPKLCDVLVSAQSPVVAPMLLADAYHARVDIPAVVAASGVRARQAAVLGEDPALLHVLRKRLTDAAVSGDDSDVGVMVVAVGSSDAAANARTAGVATALRAGTRWAGARIAFATGPHPTMAEAQLRLRAAGARRLVIAPWFLAPGRITDRIAEYALAQGMSMSEPLGSHNLVAATLLDRYDDARSGHLAA